MQKKFKPAEREKHDSSSDDTDSIAGLCRGQKTVQVEGATVGEALSALTAQYPNLRQHLFAEDGKLRSFVNVYLNDEDVRFLKYVETPVNANDKLAIVPSVAGG